MKTIANWIGSTMLVGGLACATSKPSPELLMARDAYQAAESGPAKELTPSDLHDARVMFDAAEEAAKSDGQSPVAANRAYLALRRAELANAQGKTSAAAREKQQSEQQLQALKDKSLVTTKAQLAAASAAQTQTQTQLNQTQAQLDAEHQSRVQMNGQLAEASATQQRTEAQLAQAQGQVDTEHQARLAAEQGTIDALSKVAAVRKEARGMVITLSGSVLFASGKSELLPTARQRLDQVAEALKTSDRTILVEGYTDSRGSIAGNQQLSLGRAQSVLDYLVPRGIRAERIRAVGEGSNRPIAENSSAEGRANNRRVEIVVESRPADVN